MAPAVVEDGAVMLCQSKTDRVCVTIQGYMKVTGLDANALQKENLL